jgi:hypothetical protein
MARNEQGENIAQSLTDVLQLRRRAGGKGQGILVLVSLVFGFQMLAGAWNGKALFAKQLFDTKHVLHILAPVHSLARAALHRLELRELGLPET